MSSYLSLLPGPLWCLPGRYIFYLLVLWVVTALCVHCLGRLFRCRTAIVSRVGSIRALKQGMCPGCIHLLYPEHCRVVHHHLQSHLKEQGAEVTAEDPEEITVWTSEEGQVMCLKWQAGVVLLPAKQLLIPHLLTEQDWSRHEYSSLLLPGLRPCLDPCTLFSPSAPAPGCMGTSAPSLGS